MLIAHQLHRRGIFSGLAISLKYPQNINNLMIFLRYLVRFPALPEKKVVGLERGPLSFVSTTEELLDRKVAAPV
jgi:hypothetical protein